jgi:hypothetical protein
VFLHSGSRTLEEAEQTLIELARRYPEHAVSGLLDQLVTLLGGSTPNVSVLQLVRRQLCRRTVDKLLLSDDVRRSP